MNTINKIIAVLNDFDTVENILKKASELSSQQKAILEVLYVHETPLFDVPDYFRSRDNIGNDLIDKEKIKKEIEKRLVKLGSNLNYAILVFIGDTLDQVLTQTKEDINTLIITAYHEQITEKLVQKSHLPVLVIKNSVKDYRKIVLPIDFSKNSRECIDLAQMLFSQSNMRLLYDYRYLTDLSIIDVDYFSMPAVNPNIQIEQEIKQKQKEQFQTLKKETTLEGDFIEEHLSTEEDLAQFIEANNFDLTVLCSNNRDFLFSESISFELLKMLSTDLLIYRHH